MPNAEPIPYLNQDLSHSVHLENNQQANCCRVQQGKKKKKEPREQNETAPHLHHPLRRRSALKSNISGSFFGSLCDPHVQG